MSAGESLDVVVSVTLDVLNVSLTQLLDGCDDVLDTALSSHLLGGDVRVGTCAVPVSVQWLCGEGNHDAELLGDSDEEESCEPHLVGCVNTGRWSDLEFPLGGHDLGVDARDRDLAVKARLVVCLDKITSKDFTGADTAIVWSLWRGETASGPAVWSSLFVHEGVLLLDTEPGLMGLVLLGKLGGLVSVIELVGSSVILPTFGHDDDVIPTTERVLPELDGSEEDVGVIALGLTCGGTVKVPFFEFGDVFWSRRKGLPASASAPRAHEGPSSPSFSNGDSTRRRPRYILP